MSQIKTDDLLFNQLYLSKFANVSFETSDTYTLLDLQKLSKKVEEWLKDEAKAKSRLEEMKLKSLFRGIGKMFGGK